MLKDDTSLYGDVIGLSAKERKAAYRKVWKNTEAGRKSKAKSDKKWREANPDKCKFYNALSGPGKHKRAKEKRQAWLHELKLELACSKCGFNAHPAALQFHHIDSETKTDGVSRMLHRVGTTLELILKEIAKCMVLCANCHAIHHYEEHEKRKQRPGAV